MIHSGNTVSDRWDQRKSPPRKISDAEREYRKQLKEVRKPKVKKQINVSEAKRMLADHIQRACPEFKYVPANQKLLNSLAYYAAQDHNFCQTGYDLSESAEGRSINKLSLKKGILILGRYGVGKTTIMRALARVIGAKQTTAMHIVDAYNDANSLKRFELGSWYFDDVGRERSARFAKKTDAPIMSDLIEKRYFNQSGITLLTTNLSIEEISDVYGPRVESRLWEMFNMYALGGVDYRKE